MAKRQRYIFVCTNRRADDHPTGSCAAKGSEEIVLELKRLLKDQGLAKEAVRACSASCLDVCWKGVTIAVQPDNYFYGDVTLADVEEIVTAFEKGERVERLVLKDDDFIDPKLLARQRRKEAES